MNARRPPADMLLLRERQRRMRTPMEPPASADDVILEGDEIVDEVPVDSTPSSAVGGVALYRPLSNVTLVHVPWTGSVDHAALQTAIACAPLHDDPAADGVGWLRSLAADGPAAVRDDGSLFVALFPDELAIVARARERLGAAATAELMLAVRLPVTMVGVDASTAGAAAAVFSTYRRAALVFAWRGAMSGHATAEAQRDRDAAAIPLLSTLRALLGET